MEECECPPARFKRRAWAQSRDSWQASESQDQGAEEPLSAQPMEDKTSTASETGRKPNQVENWLRTCRTPLGASLDEQSGSPSRGPLKNGCSFEDDLSLGAEANHLQKNSTKTEANGYEMAAKAKRSQFKQKGRSMNSTGSGKSSTTVSSVSELLDLYEEDPEEILYNLGFGREEPDIASKIPSRFFNSSSSAKGIDIKVYLGAQIQRMELENPNYALTSRFRQTEVLATVANVFSEIYSQVSGRPMERIGSGDIETKTPSPLKRNNSALNAAKILKRNITKQNLLASVMEGTAKQPSASDVDNTEGANSDVGAGLMDTEHKLQQKVFRKKDSSLATVTEEAQQSISDASLNGNAPKPLSKDSALMNGDHSTETPALDKDMSLSPVLVSISRVSDESDFKELERQETITSTPDKEPTNLLPNPLIAHLLSQPRDSFEMEELQSNEDEALPGPGGTSQAGSERFLRTASQQSDSSGFAEDPSTDGSGNHLKVQESSDSCDSETTVTSHAGEVSTPIALEYPNFERLQGEEAHPQSSRGTFSQSGTNRELPEITSLQSPNPNSDHISPNGPLLSPDYDRASIVESNFTTAQEPTTDSPEVDSSTMVDPATDSNLDVAHEGNICQPGLGIDLDFSEDLRPSSGPESSDLPETLDLEQCHATTQRQMDLQTAHQRSSSMDEERPARVWVRDRNLLRESLERNPLRRSSSLPTSPLSPARVVTSMRIQLGKGSVKHCTPPSYSYRYDEENLSVREEVDSIMEKDEVDHGQSELLKSAPAGGSKTDRATPPHLLNVPQHLTCSSSSLYSIPADWPQRPLGEGPNWSTCSVPNLSQFTGLAHPPPPHHGSFYSPQHGVAYNSSYPTGVPHHTPFPQPQSSPYPQPLKSNTFTPPQGAPFTLQHNMHYAHPHSLPYSPFYSPYNVAQGAPCGPSLNMHGSPYQPHVPLAQSHSAPYRLGYNGSPHHPGASYSHPYYPSPPYPCSFETPPAPVPVMGSTDMQLRRVLHDIRGTMQNLGQSSSVHGGDTPIDRISTPCSVQPLYEELQMRRRSLNVFRTQMMDLELAVMRQQSMVYQHLIPDERREAEHLEALRTAVRQELQELELQLEDHLLSLNEQMRSSSQHSSLYRHHMGMHRGHSMESLSNSSALQAMEPRGSVYRATLNLTPTVPARPGMDVPRPVSPERMEQNMTPASLELSRDEDEMSLDGHRSRTTEDCSPTEWRSTSGGNGDLQNLIQEIKESIAHEIRQEIVNELLAAVSPRRSPLPARKPPV
ncbi:sperm-specific antigen 2 homolog isoform X2 [Sinocyclocheilus anshuiensis]|uniref:sperm-specific antigen 2 homolog isoform X2 n=1 Tax=Sinocyclocheilus anshuiensis TaxID=1608454 RepID=UPI0007B93605|nr:PREDICTED: sperm-specific antigen 2 homolog isoform X2 [Sinocyclocheilus anshuiensis]